MKVYTTKLDVSSERKIIADDMVLTKDMPTAAGSKMLDGFMSLFDAEVLTRAKAAGYTLCGKADVGEFAIDLVGETSYNRRDTLEGKLTNACADILANGEAIAVLTLDANGSVRRAVAQSGLISVKPTYGTVSRYGMIPVACSGDTVSVMASTASDCRELLNAIAGHDAKDGTSLPEELCKKAKSAAPARKIAVIKSMLNGVDDAVRAKLDAFCDTMKKNGIEICEIDNAIIPASRVAWNILMTAELCNNVSRYDGVKYGYRAQNFTNLDELYINSRTEAFGELLKTAIIFGSETLSTDNYMKVYDKALRTRRVIVENFSALFGEYDAVLMPACSTLEYTAEAVKANKYLCFEENLYTAPASITGLPAVVVGGVQLVGNYFSENSLLGAAELFEKEGK